ncbi:hypothetical protein CDL15_Pgr007909 [Punica granatum]|uniref:Uncharacterized protein n=1 Tax=Punica granatum TaxID=22663 RepID=A0A218XBI4_PUNGR|nr:hypothetical protein CDL15_Pgr007909 [Punica granatum]
MGWTLLVFFVVKRLSVEIIFSLRVLPQGKYEKKSQEVAAFTGGYATREVGSWYYVLNWAVMNLKGKAIHKLLLKTAWNSYVYHV